MTTQVIRLTLAALAVVTLLLPATTAAQTAEARYTKAKTRDDNVREAITATPEPAPTSARTKVITEARAVIAAYEGLVQRHRSSGYSDNALFNAASLADALHDRFGLSTDRDSALRLYKRLQAEYPTAPLAKDAGAAIAKLEAVAAAAAPVAPASAVAAASPAAPVSRAAPTPPAKLLRIDRVATPESVRATLALDREVSFYEEKLGGPSRVFVDLKNVQAAPELKDAVLRYPSDLVRQIRIGRHPNATRVVLDLEGVAKHSVYTLYNPFRVVIDAEPANVVAAPANSPVVVTEAPVVASIVPVAAPVPVPPAGPVSSAAPVSTAAPPSLAAPVSPVAPLSPAAPALPAAPRVNGAGGFSIARQLGLGVSRIVIDPGHGGHDPGAQSRGVNEADVTLDIALRVEALLQKEPGLEVVLTRRSDVYISPEERTAIANREGADLFLSIHANTSRSSTARGVETYFLSFAGSPEAEAVAARENSSHGGVMHKLPDIVRAITLNNKLDESRDFAGMVQEALVTRLRRSNKTIPNRGVKKAPFVVLIGAEMPSVLAEVSFLTNKQELQLLKTAPYKQRIAEALHAAVMRYRRSLKGSAAVASQE